MKKCTDLMGVDGGSMQHVETLLVLQIIATCAGSNACVVFIV